MTQELTDADILRAMRARPDGIATTAVRQIVTETIDPSIATIAAVRTRLLALEAAGTIACKRHGPGRPNEWRLIAQVPA